MSLAAALLLGALAAGPEPLTVGSKAFTESVVLGEITRLALEQRGLAAVHRPELGGTRVLWEALLHGDIDLYPEYTGTLRQELLGAQVPPGEDALRDALARQGITLGPALGFNNTYALGMRRAQAEALGIRRISQLPRHPGLRLAFSHEFLDRQDGWPAVQARYGLAADRPRGIEHALAYGALSSGAVDVIDVYSTDAEIAALDLVVLEDDRQVFPEYQAVLLYRSDRAHPGVAAALGALAGRISATTMRALNAQAKIEGLSPERIASRFLGAGPAASGASLGARLLARTGEHLFLVLLSLLAAIGIAIPLGVVAARRPRLGRGILAVVGVIQTVPSLALLVLMIPLLGIGTGPALTALFLYSLLPIARNTHAGLTGIPLELRDSAVALGLPPAARLWRVELPLASPSILAGIKTAAVINVGTATLGALIGAGGYGQPILAGIRLGDAGLLLEGAVPAALLAISFELLFTAAERVVVPRGLRLSRGR